VRSFLASTPAALRTRTASLATIGVQSISLPSGPSPPVALSLILVTGLDHDIAVEDVCAERIRCVGENLRDERIWENRAEDKRAGGGFRRTIEGRGRNAGCLLEAWHHETTRPTRGSAECGLRFTTPQHGDRYAPGQRHLD
jgi:hypothetical protein